MKPRTVTRALANPIFWLAFGAYVIGVLLGGAEIPPWWVGALIGLALVTATNAIERWYVYPRTAAGMVNKSLHAARKRFQAAWDTTDFMRWDTTDFMRVPGPCPGHSNCSYGCDSRS